MQGRYLIPKSIFFYLLFFLTGMGGWMGTLFLYYKEGALALFFSEESLPFLDINRGGCLAQWFISFLWLVITLHSFMMILFVISRARREGYELMIRQGEGKEIAHIPRYNGWLRGSFWGVISIISFLMSANTTCGFAPIIQRRLMEVGQNTSGEGGVSPVLAGLVAAGLAVGFVIVRALWKYIGSIRKFRFFLYPLFISTIFILVLTVSCRFFVPVPDAVISAEAKSESVKENSEKKKDSANDSAGKTYLNVAYTESESEGAKPNSFTWEGVFGLEKSVEEELKLEKTIEEYLHLDKMSEEYILDRFPQLTNTHVRSILRNGFYGIFLVFFSTSLGFLSWSERVIFERRIVAQAERAKEKYRELMRIRRRNIRNDDDYFDVQ